MARKSSPDNGGVSTATADKPERKTRQRKSPEERATKLVVRVINDLRRLGCMVLSVTHRNEIDHAIEHEKAEMIESWESMDEPEKAPDEFRLSD